MTSTPAALDSNLNPNAKPWSPSAASHRPSPPDYSQTLQMFHHRPQPFQYPFCHPILNANFHFIYLPAALEPLLFLPHTAYNMQYPPPPLIEAYNMGYQAELLDESVQDAVLTEENRGGPQTTTRSRKRGFGRTRRSASRRDGFARAEHSNSGGDRQLSYRSPASNEYRRRALNRASRRQPKDTIPLESGGDKTSVMIRNIPNEYTRKMLKDFLIKHCKMENDGKGGEEKIHSAFDFLYLPMDFGTQMNKGYAFVNFTNPEAAWTLFLAKNNQSWDFSNSNKIRDLCCATIQGKEKLVTQFEGMCFPREEYKPLCLEPAHAGSGQVMNEIPIGVCTNRSG